ncbi:hypothetical protein WN48_07697 [Eufriesea mexicana]|uniref:Uncharacterized protein n=1 Tax=Eufriesea mexicana TaxID=516756 RepID=A0A310SSP3_9HYME|nr:hypothetical protein WN48_07697 [Eufriesea mexicana]
MVQRPTKKRERRVGGRAASTPVFTRLGKIDSCARLGTHTPDATVKQAATVSRSRVPVRRSVDERQGSSSKTLPRDDR